MTPKRCNCPSSRNILKIYNKEPAGISKPQENMRVHKSKIKFLYTMSTINKTSVCACVWMCVCERTRRPIQRTERKQVHFSFLTGHQTHKWEWRTPVVLRAWAEDANSLNTSSANIPLFFICSCFLSRWTKLNSFTWGIRFVFVLSPSRLSINPLTLRHRASSIQGQAFHYSPENVFYIFNQQIYFIIWYLLDRASLI